ncbi:MAG: hypothetical protein HYS13_24795 [Planctomycetia bacterium]|nr:hypothetical protein [Planctomycetia bacterium]
MKNMKWRIVCLSCLGAVILGALIMGLSMAGQCTSDDGAIPRKVATRELRSASGELLMTYSFYLGARGEEVLHGTRIYWAKSDLKEIQVEYRDGKQHGTYTRWHTGSLQKSEEGQFAGGKPFGQWTWWNANGNVVAKCNYKDGKIDGAKKFWNDKSNLVREEVYNDDGFMVELTAWHDNGQKRLQGSYKPRKDALKDVFAAAVVKHGTWTYWNKTGEVVAQGEWKDGKPWSGVCGVPAAGDAGSVGGILGFGEYQDGSLVTKRPDIKAFD